MAKVAQPPVTSAAGASTLCTSTVARDAPARSERQGTPKQPQRRLAQPQSAGRRRMRKRQTPSGKSVSRSGGLFRHADHMVDSRLHQIIRQIGATTLGGHHTGASLEALERMVIEDILALGDARSPR